MAGNRQHIVPRFLQSGFASRQEGKEVFVRVFNKNGTTFESNINKINVEKYFYGRGEDAGADKGITDLEQDKLSPLLEALRCSDCDPSKLKTEIAELIAHLSIRTKALRRAFEDASKFLTQEVGSYLTDFTNIEKIIDKNPNLVEVELHKILEDLQVPENLKDLLPQVVKSFLPNFDEDEKAEFSKIIDESFEGLLSSLPASIKKGHNSALASNPAPDWRLSLYEGYNWFLLESETPLILGDSCCAFALGGSNELKSIHDRDDNIDKIFLPLTSNLLLVGALTDTPPEIDFRLLNRDLARCSYEQFICSVDTSAVRELIGEIGLWSEITFTNAQEEAAREIIEDLEKPNNLSRQDFEI